MCSFSGWSAETFPHITSESLASDDSSSGGDTIQPLKIFTDLHTVQEFLLGGDPFEDLHEGLTLRAQDRP